MHGRKNKTQVFHQGAPLKILRFLDNLPSLHISESFYDCLLNYFQSISLYSEERKREKMSYTIL